MTKVLAIVPARSGSKGLPGKNIIDLHGRPLIAWTIEAARSCGIIDRVIVSTDDEKIATVAQEYKAEVPFLRPRELAADDTPLLKVVAHLICELSFRGIVVILQPTSPLRISSDIEAATNLHLETKANVIGVTKTKIHPSWIWSIADNRILAPSVADRRQLGGDRYVPNGAIYISTSECIESNRPLFHDAVPYVMPIERSIDIDTQFDLFIARSILKNSEIPHG